MEFYIFFFLTILLNFSLVMTPSGSKHDATIKVPKYSCVTSFIY